jgi:hypothetical protein
MQNFTEDQIKRQDFVDNQIYDPVKRLIPSEKKIDWEIEMIGDIRDTTQYWLVVKYKVVDEFEFYP